MIQWTLDPRGAAERDGVADCPVCRKPITFARDGNADVTADVVVTANEPVESWVAVHEREGFVVVEGLLDAEQLSRAADAVSALMDAGGENYKWIRQRTYEHFAAHPIFADLMVHPKVLAFARLVLGDDFHVVAAQCSRNLRGDPYAKGAMNIHRDGGFIPAGDTDRPLWRHGFSAMWYMQDTPLAMGPTQLIPGSHPRDEPFTDGDLVAGEDTWHRPMPAGSLLLFAHATWHRGALNGTDEPRDLITNAYTTRALGKVQLTVNVDGEQRYVPCEPLLARGDAVLEQLLS